MEKNNSRFSLFANRVASWSGRSTAFALAIGSTALWLGAGQASNYDSDWKAWASLYMSSITFILVFLIQHTQNRDTAALQIKLDELIRATHGAHKSLLKVEDLSDQEMTRLSDNYKSLADNARELVSDGHTDIHTPKMDLTAKKTGEE